MTFLQSGPARHSVNGSASDRNFPIAKNVHLATACDGTTLRLFRDGTLIGSYQIPTPLENGMLRITIGCSRVRGEFRGMIDEVRISSVARYDKDFAPAARHEPDDHTLALYHFDEGDGDVVKDSSRNNHHGKIVGQAKWVRGLPYAPPTPLDVPKSNK